MRVPRERLILRHHEQRVLDFVVREHSAGDDEGGGPRAVRHQFGPGRGAGQRQRLRVVQHGERRRWVTEGRASGDHHAAVHRAGFVQATQRPERAVHDGRDTDRFQTAAELRANMRCPVCQRDEPAVQQHGREVANKF